MRQIFLVTFILAVLTAGIYGRTIGHEFINYDDNEYITENAVVPGGLTWQSVRWAFTATEVGNWHPLTWLSHLLDAQAFGLRAWGHHLSSLLLHLGAAIALFIFLRLATGSPWRSAFTAFLFTAHPLRVESVAWAAERKDVLSGLFFMLTLLAWLRYTRRPGAGAYAAACAVFALGLMAKPMLVTLPIVLLLLDVWPFGRLRIHDGGHTWPFGRFRTGHAGGVAGANRAGVALRLVAEKIPLLMLSAASAVITVIAQRSSGFLRTTSEYPFPSLRVANALISSIRYLADALMPARLAPFYPYPGGGIPVMRAAGAALLLLILVLLVIWRRNKLPFLGTGFLWYLVMLIPVIGLVQVGPQARADRYTYLPLVGLFMVAAWMVPDRWLATSPRRLAAASLAAAVILALAATAAIQTGHWKDSETIFRHTLAVTERNYLAHTNLGYTLRRTGRLDEAADHFRAALSIEPLSFEANTGMGNLLLRMGRLAEARAYFIYALALQPDNPDANFNLGVALFREEMPDKALGFFQRAIAQKPDHAEALKAAGSILVHRNRHDQARQYLQRALRLKPGDFEISLHLGTIAAAQGRPAEAMAWFTEVLRRDPSSIPAHLGLGAELAKLGRPAEAAVHFRGVLRVDPDNAEALARLGEIGADRR